MLLDSNAETVSPATEMGLMLLANTETKWASKRVYYFRFRIDCYVKSNSGKVKTARAEKERAKINQGVNLSKRTRIDAKSTNPRL